MFQMLQQRCSITATRFQVDFEMAAMNAIHHLFPNSAVKGCFFHYTQCIWRKVQEYGLAASYNKGLVPLVKFVRRLAALPLLKPEDVIGAFDDTADLIDALNPGMFDRISGLMNKRLCLLCLLR